MGFASKIGAAVCALPVFHFVASTELNIDNAVALLTCVPRTIRAVHWAVGAGLDYYSHLRTESPTDWLELHSHWANALTSVCRQNGGVYVKAAQLLSTLGPLPEAYRSRLGQLHDRCDPKSFRKIRKSLTHELGDHYAKNFQEIDESATAAASMAQVHRAILTSGECVAVKVQYPALNKAVAADLKCLIALSKISDYIFPHYQLNWVFLQLREQISKEMDFRVEAENAHCLEQKLRHRRDVRIPKIHEELCTSRLLVMEWIDGCKLSERRRMRSLGINPRSVALTLMDIFSEMTLVHGFIHGDPHPGNLLVTPTPYITSTSIGRHYEQDCVVYFRDGLRCSWWWRMLTFQWRTPFQLVLLDHGRYLRMDQATRLDFCTLWCSLVRGDQRSAVQAATRMCHGSSGGHLLPKVLHRPFDQTTRQTIRKDTSLSDIINILHTAPQTLVDALRIAAVVRHVTSALADIRFDRAYIEGLRAWDGLSSEEAGNKDHQLTWETEVRVKLSLFMMRIAMWIRDITYSCELLFSSVKF